MNWYWWVTIFAGTPFVLAVAMLIYLRFFAPSGYLGIVKGRIDSVNISPTDKALFLLFWPEIWILEKIFDKLFEDC